MRWLVVVGIIASVALPPAASATPESPGPVCVIPPPGFVQDMCIFVGGLACDLVGWVPIVGPFVCFLFPC